MIDKQKEEVFYAKDFNFSYSSINKLNFCPSLFYKDYILGDREIRTEKHLIEGKLIHCLLFEPDNVEKKFNVSPGKSPSDNIIGVMKDMSLYTDSESLDDIDDSVILDSLKSQNLYQSLKTDESRIAKIRTVDNGPYWTFINSTIIDVIDNSTLENCKRQVEILKENEDVKALFLEKESDFELDQIEVYAEKYLSCKLKTPDFGLHGYIDYYKIDHEKKLITICDLKTTGKTISDFPETIDFYNYWMQAAIYYKLVHDNLDEKCQSYEILFKFVVIDKYNQVYVFDVLESTMSSWAQGLFIKLQEVNYHYSKRNYSLPYKFLNQKIRL